MEMLISSSKSPEPIKATSSPATSPTKSPKSPRVLKEVKVNVFTIEGIKEYLENNIKGKVKAREKYTLQPILVGKAKEYEDLDFEAIIKKYSEETPEAFEKHFTFNAIYIDEAQDIDASEIKWIRKLWAPRGALGRKLWMFGDSDQNLNKFQGVTVSLLSTVEEDNIQCLTMVLRPTENIFEKYHKVWYEGGSNHSIGANNDEAQYDSDEDDNSRTGQHCELCGLNTSKVRGQDTEQEDIGKNILCETLAKRLLKLVKDEEVLIENIAIICVNAATVPYLKINLPSWLTGSKEMLTKERANLQFILAEEFATRCSKIKKSGKKRSRSGTVIQKKYMMIDTVRRSKGLQAEVGKGL